MELMITVALLSIILAISVPLYGEFTRKQGVRVSAQVLLKALTSARIEAITSDQSSALVCWNNGAADINVPGTSTAQVIAPGEIVVAQGDLAATTNVTSAQQLLSAQQSIVLMDNDDDDCITFDAQGRLGDSTDASVFGFLICRQAAGSDQALANIDSQRVEVSASGRAVVKLNTDTTGWGIQQCP